MVNNLLEYLLKHYSKAEFISLFSQYQHWQQLQPFKGRRILDATPVYRNTLSKYLPLIAGGAELFVVCGRDMPCASNAMELLQKFNINVASEANLGEEFDVVMDCAGALNQVKSKFGYVELTRSGEQHYKNSSKPVFLADAGKIKTIETALGTGDGFRRGLEHLGYTLKDKNITLFGCGKVGRGIAMYAYWYGAKVTVVDKNLNLNLPKDIEVISMDNRIGIEQALANSWCMVSATGILHALDGLFDASKVINSDILIANMGVEDEFGPSIPTARVLNNKQPLNFILDEPTHLKFIETTMALDNFGAYKLLTSPEPLPQGIILPSATEEQEILEVVFQHGAISKELKKMQGFI